MGNSYDHLMSYHDRQIGDFTNITVLIKEAKRAGLWIYSERRWFSPEEFEEKCKGENALTNKQIFDILAHAKIRDPRAGINAGYKQLDELLGKYQKETQELRDKLEEFNKRVITYYQEKKR